ncbi:MAG: hypothetical protein ABI903_05305 [Actinomycetota bacterium]
MHAQILYSEEVENLAGRVSDAVVDLLADLSSELTDDALRTTVDELVITIREQLIRQPVDPAPMVRAILRRDQVGRRLSPDEPDEFGIALAPAKPREKGELSRGTLVVVEPPIGGKALVLFHPQVVDDVPAVEKLAVAVPPVVVPPVVVPPVVVPPVVAAAPVTGFRAPSYWPAVPVISGEPRSGLPFPGRPPISNP